MMNRWVQILSYKFDSLDFQLQQKMLSTASILINRQRIWSCKSGIALHQSLNVLKLKHQLKILERPQNGNNANLKVQIIKISDDSNLGNMKRETKEPREETGIQEETKVEVENGEIEQESKLKEEENDAQIELGNNSQIKNKDSNFMFFKPSLLKEDIVSGNLIGKREDPGFASKKNGQQPKEKKLIEEFDLDDILGHPELNLS